MKLFEIDWDITCGEYGFVQTEIMAFKTYAEAWKYGRFREAEDNTFMTEDYDKVQKKKKITDKFLEKIREKAAWKGRVYKLSSIKELNFIIGNNNKTYKIGLKEDKKR